LNITPPTGASGLSYRDAGVDIDAGDELVERIKPAVRRSLRPEVLNGLGGFGALFQLDLQRWKQPVLVSGTDGVGTKLLLARQLNRHDCIGIDLVAMCVNDILTSGAEPLFFLDYFATGKLELEVAETVINGIAEGCRLSGCSLIGGETAEMPGMYGAGDYDLAGFAVGVVERSRLLDGSRIRPGHKLLGMASSGPHSNGYSLIRKVLERSAASLDELLVNADGSTVQLGDALLAPTTLYVRPILAMLAADARDGGIDGLAHITGGGLTENIVRIIPDDCGLQIDPAAWTRPAVFGWLQQQGGISETEMLRTFNCGIGMVLVAAEAAVAGLIEASRRAGIPCCEIGNVIQRKDAGHPGKRVEYVTR
jgi:phosphoribosylformylglycinamidine cyclo-ligase